MQQCCSSKFYPAMLTAQREKKEDVREKEELQELLEYENISGKFLGKQRKWLLDFLEYPES